MSPSLSRSVFALFLCALLPMHTVLAAFSDVPKTHPYSVAITYFADKGIIKGYPDGTFKPAQVVNRAESLKLILEGASQKVPERVTEVSFSDMKPEDWFARYVMFAKNLGIVNGNPDGTFKAGRTVTRAEFLKMLLLVNKFKAESWKGTTSYKDVPKDAWFAVYMNFAGSSGLILPDAAGNLYPSKELTRGELADIMYLLTIILKGNDLQFLISQAEAQMGQIEVYISAKNVGLAKRASELSVDFTQQAYKLAPTNTVVLGAAKVAKAYDMVVTAFIAGLEKDTAKAKTSAEQAIAKADEAIKTYPEVKPIADHIKTRAQEILKQL